jgi:hypothetical protein
MIVQAIRRVHSAPTPWRTPSGIFRWCPAGPHRSWRVRQCVLLSAASTQPPITTTHQRPPLSQRGAYARQRFKDHPHFRRPSAHYRVQFTPGQLTSTITGPEFVCSGFSRHIPANFAFAINALTAAEAQPFSAIALARAASASTIRPSSAPRSSAGY